MNKPPRPPGPPKFEPPSDDWWGRLTDEDREWLEEELRQGRLKHLTSEWAKSEIEAAKKRALDRMRKNGLDPDASEEPKQ